MAGDRTGVELAGYRIEFLEYRRTEVCGGRQLALIRGLLTLPSSDRTTARMIGMAGGRRRPTGDCRGCRGKQARNVHRRT
jgi:hypothetical protein